MTAPQLDAARYPDAPGARLGTVLQLADELDDVTRATDQALARVEEATALRRGELAALLAVDEGARHPRAVARHSGQVDDAGAVTTEALLRRGLLRWADPHGTSGHAGRAAVLEVTEAGRVVLQQAEGLRIRALDALVGALGPRETAVLRSAVRALTGALDAAGGSRDGCREIDSPRVVVEGGP